MVAHLEAQGLVVHHVDGDDLRALTVNADYSRVGRENNIRKAQTIAQFLQSKGQTVVVSLVAPYRTLREEFKSRAKVTECMYTPRSCEEGKTNTPRITNLRWKDSSTWTPRPKAWRTPWAWCLNKSKSECITRRFPH